MSSPEHIWNNGFVKHDRQAVKYYDERTTFGFAGSEQDYLGLSRPDWKDYRFAKLRLSSEEFLSRMRTSLGDRLEIALVTDSSGVAVAGSLMLFDSPKSPHPGIHLLGIKFSPSRNIHSVVTFINWKAIVWAHENGFKYVNFGSFPVAHASEPDHNFYRLRERFEITITPRNEFTVPISNISYSIAKRINQTLRSVRGR
jgi:hypothetical protein